MKSVHNLVHIPELAIRCRFQIVHINMEPTNGVEQLTVGCEGPALELPFFAINKYGHGCFPIRLLEPC